MSEVLIRNQKGRYVILSEKAHKDLELSEKKLPLEDKCIVIDPKSEEFEKGKKLAQGILEGVKEGEHVVVTGDKSRIG